MELHLDRNLILESNCSFEEARFGIMGVPFDSTCSYRPGCRFGPLAIRREFIELEKPACFFDIPLYDLGNLYVIHGNLKETLNLEEDTLKKAFERNQGFIPVVLGGEHSVSYAPVKVLAEKHPGLQVVHFDAHADLKDDYLGEKWSHATVMKRIAQLGVDYCQKGVRILDDEEKALVRDTEPKKGVPTYISIDLDVLDPSVAPGVGTPEPNGMIYSELLSELKGLLDSTRVVGLDIVELSPPYDVGGITAVTAANLLLNMLTDRGHKHL